MPSREALRTCFRLGSALCQLSCCCVIWYVGEAMCKVTVLRPLCTGCPDACLPMSLRVPSQKSLTEPLSGGRLMRCRGSETERLPSELLVQEWNSSNCLAGMR